MSTQGRGLCGWVAIVWICVRKEASKPISEQIQQKTMKSNNGKILKTTLKANMYIWNKWSDFHAIDEIHVPKRKY